MWTCSNASAAGCSSRCWRFRSRHWRTAASPLDPDAGAVSPAPVRARAGSHAVSVTQPVIRMGTRGSALALYQTRWIAARLRLVAPEATVEMVEISSAGDQITDVPLSMMEGTGFFTSSIERALIAGEVDMAVHSFKDLPVEATPRASWWPRCPNVRRSKTCCAPRAAVRSASCRRGHPSAPAARDARRRSAPCGPTWTSARCAATCRRASAASPTASSTPSSSPARGWCGSGSTGT